MLYSPYVNDLKEMAEFEGPFLVKMINLQLDKNGKAYVTLVLMDKTGEIEARVWENAQRVSEQIKSQDIVRVSGKVNFYQGKKQIVVVAVEPAAANAYPQDRFFPSTTFDIGRMYADVTALMQSMEDPFAQKLALTILEDPELKKLIIRAPAAKNVHHAYAGGLLEHVLSVCRILDLLAIHYRNYYGKAVSRDLLLLGGLLHDIGKIFELSFERGTEYSTEGRLLGHLIQGCELVDKTCAKIENFPEQLRVLVKHQILAHHGRMEYGSPKLPHTMEALIVHMVDDLDSKVNSILGLIERDNQPGQWTGTLRLYERAFFKPQTLPKTQGPSPGVAT
jgi:3'-5' exoribonuclease